MIRRRRRWCSWSAPNLKLHTTRYDLAASHFSEAMEIHERLHAPYWIASTQLEWARMLLARHQPGDTDRARQLLGRTLDTGRQLGLINIERRSVALLE